LAIDTLVHRTAATVGGTIASLGGLDALVFTGGIGEHSSMIRKRVCAPFGFLGLHLDRDRKARIDGDTLVSRADSHVLVLVVEAREDLVILRALKRVLRA
jgi:acetate kinase